MGFYIQYDLSVRWNSPNISWTPFHLTVRNTNMFKFKVRIMGNGAWYFSLDNSVVLSLDYFFRSFFGLFSVFFRSFFSLFSVFFGLFSVCLNASVPLDFQQTDY
jgi:hypothetical protein